MTDGHLMPLEQH